MAEVELCACGHANDHTGRPCSHPAIAINTDEPGKCACLFGQRIDIAAFRIAVETNQILARLLAVTEVATGTMSRIDPLTGRVEVRRRPQPAPNLIVPR